LFCDGCKYNVFYGGMFICFLVVLCNFSYMLVRGGVFHLLFVFLIFMFISFSIHLCFLSLFFIFLAFLQLSLLCFFLLLLVFVFSITFAISFIFMVHLLENIENNFLFLGLGLFCLVGFEFTDFFDFFWLFGSIENTMTHKGHTSFIILFFFFLIFLHLSLCFFLFLLVFFFLLLLIHLLFFWCTYWIVLKILFCF
jgi:hypothetical protein